MSGMPALTHQSRGTSRALLPVFVLLPCENRKSAQPSPTQKEGINAPFLNGTSEVIQWFIYINVTLLHKN
jgi:hypothetical protein